MTTASTGHCGEPVMSRLAASRISSSLDIDDSTRGVSSGSVWLSWSKNTPDTATSSPRQSPSSASSPWSDRWSVQWLDTQLVSAMESSFSLSAKSPSSLASTSVLSLADLETDDTERRPCEEDVARLWSGSIFEPSVLGQASASLSSATSTLGLLASSNLSNPPASAPASTRGVLLALRLVSGSGDRAGYRTVLELLSKRSGRSGEGGGCNIVSKALVKRPDSRQVSDLEAFSPDWDTFCSSSEICWLDVALLMWFSASLLLLLSSTGFLPSHGELCSSATAGEADMPGERFGAKHESLRTTPTSPTLLLSCSVHGTLLSSTEEFGCASYSPLSSVRSSCDGVDSIKLNSLSSSLLCQWTCRGFCRLSCVALESEEELDTSVKAWSILSNESYKIPERTGSGTFCLQNRINRSAEMTLKEYHTEGIFPLKRVLNFNVLQHVRHTKEWLCLLRLNISHPRITRTTTFCLKLLSHILHLAYYFCRWNSCCARIFMIWSITKREEMFIALIGLVFADIWSFEAHRPLWTDPKDDPPPPPPNSRV